jgi:glyoxylase-like metal-dependent hydrolase (beta-lactamase superfamily II)
VTVLELLAPGVYAWLAEQPAPGHPNAGVVLDPDGATVIDTLCVPSQHKAFAEAVEALGFPIRRIVLTGDHIEFVGGTVSFPMAAVYGSPAASAHLDQPPNPDVYRNLFPLLADEFDDEMQTRRVSHIVDDVVQLTPAITAIPVSGQSATNLVVLVAEAGIAFAGAMASFGVTPLAFDGDPEAWIETLGDLAELAPTVVPGHGAVGGRDEIWSLQSYLRACMLADGDPAALAKGPWDRWPGRERHAVNVERAAMLAHGDHGVPPSMLRLAGLV